MKKRVRAVLAAVLTLLMCMSLLAGCGNSGNQNTTPTEENKETKAAEEVKENSGDEALRVLLLVPGTLGDKSFFDSANAGMDMIKEHYGAETKVVEMGTDTTKFSATLDDVCNEGWDVIITGGVNIAEPLQEAAAEYPDQKFILYDESVDFSDGANANIYCITYKSYEGAYLAGVLAASQTETGILGFAGGFDIPLINDWLVGYISGAQAVRSDIKVSAGYMSSFTDAAKGKEIGLALYNGGADVVLQAAGGAGLGVLDAAKETGKHAIGTDSDQSELFSNDEAKANAIYASIMKRVDVSLDKAIEKYIAGDLAFGSSEIYGIAEGCIEITDNAWYQANVSQEVRDAVEQAKQDIIDGKIVVATAFDMTDDEVAALKESVQP